MHCLYFIILALYKRPNYKLFSLILTPFLLLSFSNSKAMDRIVVPMQQDITNAQNNYFYELLELVMDATYEKYGDYEIIDTAAPIPQKRAMLMLEQNQRINLFWTMTSVEREEKLQAVYFPLLKGLLGHRVFIINKNKQPQFNEIHSLKQLAVLKAGQGANWPDTTILKHNGLTVVDSLDYHTLFLMLKANRYDYFPRGITEVWGELNHLNDDALAVESNLLLRYKAPIYFFVNKEARRLHQRLSDGLYKMLADGSFDRLFNEQKNIQQGLKNTNLHNRIVIDLENPDTLNKDVFNDKRLWMPLSIKH